MLLLELLFYHCQKASTESLEIRRFLAASATFNASAVAVVDGVVAAVVVLLLLLLLVVVVAVVLSLFLFLLFLILFLSSSQSLS